MGEMQPIRLVTGSGADVVALQGVIECGAKDAPLQCRPFLQIFGPVSSYRTLEDCPEIPDRAYLAHGLFAARKAIHQKAVCAAEDVSCEEASSAADSN